MCAAIDTQPVLSVAPGLDAGTIRDPVRPPPNSSPSDRRRATRRLTDPARPANHRADQSRQSHPKTSLPLAAKCRAAISRKHIMSIKYRLYGGFGILVLVTLSLVLYGVLVFGDVGGVVTRMNSIAANNARTLQG